MTKSKVQRGFLRNYEPGVAAEAKKSLVKLRKLTPNAVEMVYDNYNALVVEFCPGVRPSEVIVSIAVMPEWVNLFFLQGAGLPDPEKLLSGTGNVARHIKMEKGVARLDEPAVQTLIGEALVGAKVPVPAGQKRRFLIKSISAKQRQRRPSDAKRSGKAMEKTRGWRENEVLRPSRTARVCTALQESVLNRGIHEEFIFELVYWHSGLSGILIAAPRGIDALQERPSPVIKPVPSPNAPKNHNAPTAWMDRLSRLKPAGRVWSNKIKRRFGSRCSGCMRWRRN